MTPEEQLTEATKQIETLKTQLADASKGADEGLRTQLSDLEKLNKELIKGRDDAKDKKRKAEEDALKEQGEFKTLSEKLQGDNADLTGQLEKANGRLDGYTTRDEARLATLLESVHEDFRADISNEALPLETRLSLAEKHATVKPAAPGSRPAGEHKTNSISRQDFDVKSQSERSAFIKEGGTVHD